MDMNLESMRSWVTKISATTELIFELQTKLDTLSIQRHFAAKDENHRLELKLGADVSRLTRQNDLMLEELLAWTACADLEAVGTLLADLQVRLTAALAAFQEWRAYLARVEFVETTYGFVGAEESHREAQQKAALLAAEYEMHLRLVQKHIPEGGVA